VRNSIYAAVIMALTAILWPHTAHAQYVDPTAGGLLLQIVFGGVAGLAVGVKIFWHRISALWHRSKAETGDPPSALDNDD